MQHADWDDTADWISWKQIFTGFVVVFCIAAALVFGVTEVRTGQSLEWIPVTIIVVGAAMVTMFETWAGNLHADVLSQRPGLDNALQWTAIVLLCAFSAATIVVGLAVTPI